MTKVDANGTIHFDTPLPNGTPIPAVLVMRPETCLVLTDRLAKLLSVCEEVIDIKVADTPLNIFLNMLEHNMCVFVNLLSSSGNRHNTDGVTALIEMEKLCDDLERDISNVVHVFERLSTTIHEVKADFL